MKQTELTNVAAGKLDVDVVPESSETPLLEDGADVEQGCVGEWASKCSGADGSPPAGTNVKESVWTFVCVFSTLFVISYLSKEIAAKTNGEYFLLLGNFGATMTLIFDVHKAPAAQPRNMILGSTVSASIAVLVCKIPETYLPVWIRVALVPALAIATMGKLGLTHPPAGAAALIYSQGMPAVIRLGWMYLLIPLLLGNIICIIMATLLNNVSKERHYPTYWAFNAQTWVSKS